jgi:hypothetical protein
LSEDVVVKVEEQQQLRDPQPQITRRRGQVRDREPLRWLVRE